MHTKAYQINDVTDLPNKMIKISMYYIFSLQKENYKYGWKNRATSVYLETHILSKNRNLNLYPQR